MVNTSLTKHISLHTAATQRATLPIHGVPDGADALMVAQATRVAGDLVTFVARDASRATAVHDALSFFAGDIPVLRYPAWDCLPYDRISPSVDIVAERMATLVALSQRRHGQPLILLTQVNALTQRTVPRRIIANSCFAASPGSTVQTDVLIRFLVENGYARSSTVREPGEFAVRGGLIDIYPPGFSDPVRLDFFGDILEKIRTFDPDTQRTTAPCSMLQLAPASEILLNEARAQDFRRAYRTAFGPAGDDPLYEAAQQLRKHAGMEHFLPLFYEPMETLFDHIEDGLVFTDHLVEEAVHERFSQLNDYYAARSEKVHQNETTNSEFKVPLYKTLKPEALYLSPAEWEEAIKRPGTRPLSPFAPPDGTRAFDFGARQGRSFAAERSAGNINVFDTVAQHAIDLKSKGHRVIISGWSTGSVERMRTVLQDTGLPVLSPVSDWLQIEKSDPQLIHAMVLGLESGFVTDDYAIISESDILGDRLVRRRGKRRAENFLTEASTLSIGDLIVHVEHGVGRYEGLKTLDISGAERDCLHLTYAGGDKLFLPVENIELLSRFGSDDPNASLDKLGSVGWQKRKAKMRDRIRMMAADLIQIAAKREMRKADLIMPSAGDYEAFCTRFPYAETDDQENAITDVLEDLARGRPMDRLICGDVGFGKTEIALRAAFIVAMSGRQVAVITPTTLLARQHFQNFTERFSGFPLKVRQLSRMISVKEASEVKNNLASGDVDVVIGTHALLAKQITFKDLALVIVDEEQHFGVKHKERLKEFRSDTHVLTLTATPIPRTLQLSMSGIRDLSLIATPPVDRLAIRTTIGPFDPVVARETLLREHFRGGQSFYVAPRIADLSGIAEFLTEQIPEIRFKTAHGQMPAGELEDIMHAFYEGKFDVLLATTIIESGIDVPTANTLLVHKADMFGLAQLYQIRGRVGRSKLRAYAYLTTSARKKMTSGAERRLKILQSLDTLGAGFTLASHDLDIRGAGNLLGEEQSGNVKEVGVELYQHMLEEAVSSLKEGGGDVEDVWSPSINIGSSALIPETYVEDLDVRMSLYRRLANLTHDGDLEEFGAELIDRFGSLPATVEHLLKIASIKSLCRRAGVAKIDAGPKGAVVSFRHDQFINPAGLIQYISHVPEEVKLRPDQKIVFKRHWPNEKLRLRGCKKVLTLLVAIAEGDENAPLPRC